MKIPETSPRIGSPSQEGKRGLLIAPGAEDCQATKRAYERRRGIQFRGRAVLRRRPDCQDGTLEKSPSRQLQPAAPKQRNVLAFTLIELLVVISIIALLAGLVVGMAGAAISKGRISLAATQRDQLITAIQSYQSKKGFFPPGNTNSTIQTPLYYELSGATVQSDGSFRTADQLTLTPAVMNSLFSVGGIINASADSSEVVNFLHGWKANQTGRFANGPQNYTLMGVGVSGPYTLNSQTGIKLNPWHYNSATPSHNLGSYDLWIDITIRGKTNRVSNWAKDPEIVNDFTP